MVREELCLKLPHIETRSKLPEKEGQESVSESFLQP